MYLRTVDIYYYVRYQYLRILKLTSEVMLHILAKQLLVQQCICPGQLTICTVAQRSRKMKFIGGHNPELTIHNYKILIDMF